MLSHGNETMSDVLWEADEKYVPIGFFAGFHYDYAELFIVEKIKLIDHVGGDYKSIKLISKKVSFTNNGAVVARAGSIVVGSVLVGASAGIPRKIEIYGYVAGNESLRQQTPYGDIVIKNMKATDCPCIHHPGNDFVDCIMNYYTELLSMGVDIEGMNREYTPWEELERTVCVLLLASIKERLMDSMKRLDNPYIRSLSDSLAASCGGT
jgi:hypothetical protein